MPADATSIWYAAHACQIALGIVFLLAATAKLRRPAEFAQTIAGYRLLPAVLTLPTAWILVSVESFLAITLLTGWLHSVALPLAIGVLLIFLAAAGLNLRRGLRVRCGCFGAEGERLSARTMVRLLMLLGMVMLLVVLGTVAGTEALMIDEVFLDRSGPTYLLLISTLAVFALLCSRWLLSLPELTAAIRGVPRPVSAVNTTRRGSV